MNRKRPVVLALGLSFAHLPGLFLGCGGSTSELEPEADSPSVVDASKLSIEGAARALRIVGQASQDYWATLRPDVELLAGGIPSPHAKFQSPTFWGPAKQGNAIIRDG
jgi:hypothetical protein